MSREPVATRSSGNPFADLGLDDAETRLAKATLALQITAVMREQGLTQAEIADKMGIDQPQVSKIARGELKDFSIWRLLKLVKRLNMDVEINVTPNPEPNRPARMVVRPSREPMAAAGPTRRSEGVRFD
jgi:predicted XRE-type DNA-binding protein